MPPVEVNTIPASDLSKSELSMKTLTDLKMIEKAKELPVVVDTLSELEKVKNSLSENSSVKHVQQMVEDGIKTISEHDKVKEGVKAILDNEKVKAVLENGQEKVKAVLENEQLNQTVSNVKDSVIPRVSGAIEQLDSYACTGLESLTTAIPALNTPTPDLYKTSKEAAEGYVYWAAEYVASFTLSQLGLRMADTSLSLAEKASNMVAAGDKESMAYTARKQMGVVRRGLRALRRAGARNVSTSKATTLADTGYLGKVADLFSINTVLRVAGLEVVPSRVAARLAKKAGEPLDDSFSKVQDLNEDMDAYVSEEDPDYTTESSSSEDEDDEAEEGAVEEEKDEPEDVEEEKEDPEDVDDEIEKEEPDCDESFEEGTEA
eukprot:TRINITY_DN30_c0_g1_i2.p1 TRINITY_DN30_c0_g1~~TRINITY_DN30_c0_g1_i2.p1  ORF type:complete len:376 (-),score=180.72 TRINITY_DN30_c0_g1_i2:70-1197(-)